MLSQLAALVMQASLLQLHCLDHHHMGYDNFRIHQVDRF
jgi:hypothetical protein